MQHTPHNPQHDISIVIVSNKNIKQQIFAQFIQLIALISINLLI